MELSRMAQRVLMVLENGMLDASRRKIAQEAGCSLRSVARSLNELEQAGVVARTRVHTARGGLAPNSYTLCSKPCSQPVHNSVESVHNLDPSAKSLTLGSNRMVEPIDPRVEIVVDPRVKTGSSSKEVSKQENQVHNPNQTLSLLPLPLDSPVKARSTQRPPDVIWDALVWVFGEPLTDSERSLRNKVTASLKRAHATPIEVFDRCKAWPEHFPGCTLTPTALEKHWTQLGLAVLRWSQREVTRRRRREYESDRSSPADRDAGDGFWGLIGREI